MESMYRLFLRWMELERDASFNPVDGFADCEVPDASDCYLAGVHRTAARIIEIADVQEPEWEREDEIVLTGPIWNFLVNRRDEAMKVLEEADPDSFAAHHEYGVLSLLDMVRQAMTNGRLGIEERMREHAEGVY